MNLQTIIINMIYKSKVAFGWEENIVGKGCNTGFQHSILFPQFLINYLPNDKF